jgi:hypothetical protein
MRRWLRPVLVCALVVSLPLSLPKRRAFSAAGSEPRVPVVVELFTSEGCSSCPPADALLAELDRTQPVPEALIIPLEEHVDYWNSDGWRDPFSSSVFTARQEAYARRFGIAGPYTPQMVVAGRTDVLGSAGGQARAAVAAAAHLPQVEVSLTVSTGAPPDAILHTRIQVNSLPAEAGEAAKVYLAVTENALASNVSAGENSGRRLEHRAVVRKISLMGSIEAGKPFSASIADRMAPGWKRENLRVVVFLEGGTSGKILGAATSAAGR